MSAPSRAATAYKLFLGARRTFQSGCSPGGAPLGWQSQGHASGQSAWSPLWAGLPANAGGRGLATSTSRSLRRNLKHTLHNYKQLSKAKLSALVVLTAAGGFVAGSGDAVDWSGLAWTCAGTFGAAACANALNQVYEVANDARMARTAARPLPAGRMSRAHALAFAAATGAAGLWVLAEKANPLAASLGAANIGLYAAVYTPLKQLTVANTWVGALVGAVPPLMGWAAAAGQLEPGAWVLALALFSWQMPHFMALAWMCRDDYARGGFRMLPMIDPTGRRTAGVALRHCAALSCVGAAAAALGVASGWFAGEAAALAAVMGAGGLAFAAAPSQQSARKLFKGSLLYLPLLLGALCVHRLPHTHTITSLADVRQLLEQRWGLSPSLGATPAASPDPEADAVEPCEEPGSGVAEVWRRVTAGTAEALTAVCDRLPALPPLRLKSAEERLGPYLPSLQQLHQQLGRCPSRVYGDARDEGERADAAAQPGQQHPTAAAAAAADGDAATTLS